MFYDFVAVFSFLCRIQGRFVYICLAAFDIDQSLFVFHDNFFKRISANCLVQCLTFWAFLVVPHYWIQTFWHEYMVDVVYLMDLSSFCGAKFDLSVKDAHQPSPMKRYVFHFAVNKQLAR